MANINGKIYDWSSITINIPGMNEIQAQDISYDDELEKEAAYGRGNAMRGYGTGNYKATAKMTLLKEDYDDIVNYCKKSSVPIYRLEIPKISVAYANDGQRTQLDVLKDVTFTKVSHKATQGDKNIKVDIDMLIYGEIIRNGLNAI